MDGFCLLYLLLILLMRSGDIETNPGPNTAVSTVSDMEFLRLARDILPSDYKAVGISLGFSFSVLQNILEQELKDYPNAFLHVFMKWKDMKQLPHSNKRQLLADKLREIDLGGLSDRLLNESLIPNITGGPSRLTESQTKPPSAESQTKPLSPELVERCADEIKSKYRSTVCKIRADPLNPASIVQLKDMYTNLFLQKENGTEKQMLDYNDILNLDVNGEFPKRIMVQGEAGAGKTTLCAKIAWDWIEEDYFKQFVWVLIVPLREFKKHTIGEIAKSYLAKNNPATVSQMTEYIQSNPDKVFIAFDGLDEASGLIMKTKSCESQPSVTSSEACGSSSETGDIGLVDILCSDQLASCPVLVTTRPWRAMEIRSDGDLMKLYTFIHVEGFNRKNLSVYIHKYFPKNDDKANQLIQFFSDNDVISENMAPYPIYVAMLCLMWKKRDEQKLKKMKSLKTFSLIFKEMIAFLKEHYAQKEVKKVGSPSLIAYLKKNDELLGPIAKQAFNGLLENTLTFGEDDFQKCEESKDTACRVGILSQEDRITADMDTHERNCHVQLPVFFPHKLFQEYMAGVHLASLYELNHNEFNRLIGEVVLPRKEEFRYLLYFTVSQNKSIATHVMNSMLQGLYMNRGASQEQIDFIVDVAFESQDPDVAALVKDRVSSKEIVLVIPRDMKAHTVAGYAFIGPHVVDLRMGKDCGPTISLDLAEIICTMPSLKKAFLHGELHHNFFATLARKGKESQVQTLKLHAVRCPTPASSHYLAEALCSMPNLTNLTLGMDLNEEFYSTLKEKASSIQVQTLMLVNDKSPKRASSNQLEDAHCSTSNLTDLTLAMDLTEEFHSTLKAKPSSIKVQALMLVDDNSPKRASSHHLAEALCFMPNLTVLTLGMDVNDEFYSTLKAKAPHIQLTQINTKTKWLPPEGTSSMSVSEPSGCEATPSRTETRDIQQTAEEIHAQYEFQAEGRGGRDGNQVHWYFLTDSPQELTLQDNEAVISCGIRFSPTGAKLSNPIKVTLDHDAHFSNPRRAEIVLYTRNKDSKSFERMPASTSGYPRCDVRAKDLDLYVDHFSDWWIVVVFTRYFIGKRVTCMSYVRQPVRKDSTHLVHLCIYDDLLDVIHKIQEDMKEYTKLHPPQPMFIAWKCGDINIKLFDGPKGNEQKIDEQIIGQRNIYLFSTNPISFEVKPLEPGVHQRFLKFTLNQKGSLSDTTSMKFPLPYDDMGTTTTAEAQEAGAPMLPWTDLESDRILNEVSEHMPSGSYIKLCTELGITYDKAKGILLGVSNDFQMATRDCLAQWKTRTGGDMAQLKIILVAAGVKHLVKFVK